MRSSASSASSTWLTPLLLVPLLLPPLLLGACAGGERESTATNRPTTAADDGPSPTGVASPPTPSPAATEAATGSPASDLVAGFDFPDELGAGWRRADGPAPELSSDFWSAIEALPECAVYEVALSVDAPQVEAGIEVQYPGPLPGQNRNIVLLQVDDAVGEALLAANGSDGVNQAHCYQEAFRAGIGFPGLEITDEGLGRLPELGVDAVWRRQRIRIPELGVEFGLASLTMARSPFLLTASLIADPTDADVVAIATDLAARLESAPG